MGVRTVTVEEITCDYCGLKVHNNNEWIDASVYGVAFHSICVRSMSVADFIRICGIDNILWRNGDRDGKKVCYNVGPLGS